MSELKKIFQHNTLVRSKILDYLPATYASLVLWLCNVKLEKWEEKKYLNIIRDIEEQEDWTREKIAQGALVVLLGKDLVEIENRINNPGSFWNKNSILRNTSICIIVIDPRSLNDVLLFGTDATVVSECGSFLLLNSNKEKQTKLISNNLYLLKHEKIERSKKEEIKFLGSLFLVPNNGTTKEGLKEDYCRWYQENLKSSTKVTSYFYLEDELSGYITPTIQLMIDSSKYITNASKSNSVNDYYPDLINTRNKNKLRVDYIVIKDNNLDFTLHESCNSTSCLHCMSILKRERHILVNLSVEIQNGNFIKIFKENPIPIALESKVKS